MAPIRRDRALHNPFIVIVSLFEQSVCTIWIQYRVSVVCPVPVSPTHWFAGLIKALFGIFP